MTTPELIDAVGRALYGVNYKAPLARDMRVSKDAVADWSKGRSEPHPGRWLRLMELCEARQKTLADAILNLKNASISR